MFTADGRSTRAVAATATDDRDRGGFVGEVEVRGQLAVGVTTGRDVVAFDIRTGQRRWTRRYSGVDITFAHDDDRGRLGIVATRYGDDDEVPVIDTVGSGDGKRRTSARLPAVAEGPFTYVQSGTTLIAAQATDLPDAAPWLAAYVPA